MIPGFGLFSASERPVEGDTPGAAEGEKMFQPLRVRLLEP
jgi:hypothetical protein